MTTTLFRPSRSTARTWVRSASAVVLALALAACSGLPAQAPHIPTYALPDASGTPLGTLVAASKPPDVRAGVSGYRLLGLSAPAYGSRMALIDAAKKTLDLQYYAIHYDSSTEALMEHLRDAARRGVRVRLLLDDFNAVGKNVEVLKLDLESGMEVRMFNPVSGSRNSQVGRIVGSLFDFQRIQQRMHNKMLIADNALAVTGGRNLGDAYFGQSETSNFLDLDVLAAGPVVQALSHSFDAYWNDARSYPVQSLLNAQDRAKFHAPSTAVAATLPAPAASAETGAITETDKPVVPRPVPGATDIVNEIAAGKLPLVWAPSALLVDKPTKIAPENPQDETDHEDNVVDGVMNLVARAQKDVLIVSPYFVPGPRMMEVFTGLRQRGVRVRVLTNSLASNDAPLAHVGYARYRQALLEAGVELYEMRAEGKTKRRFFGSAPDSRASLHAKALVVDSRILVVGSMNLDLRSAIQNTELGIVIRSRALSNELTETIVEGLADSYRISLENDAIRWHPPKDATDNAGEVLTTEPDTSLGLRILLKLAGPFAPDEML